MKKKYFVICVLLSFFPSITFADLCKSYYDNVCCAMGGGVGNRTSWVMVDNDQNSYLFYNVGYDTNGSVSGIAEVGPSVISQQSTCDAATGIVTFKWDDPTTFTSGEIIGDIKMGNVSPTITVHEGSYIKVKNQQRIIKPEPYIGGYE